MAPSIVPPFNGVLDAAALARTATWRPLVEATIQRLGLRDVVPASLALGLIYAESRGKANAVSPEGSSYGLMQVNAAVHYAGRPKTDLLVPATNIAEGLPVIADAIRDKGGDIPAAISRYNGGSGNRQRAGTRFCVMWKAGTPHTSLDRDCARMYVTRAEGEFGNHPYVAEVLAAMGQFRASVYDGPAPTTPSSPGDGDGSTAAVLAVIGLGIWALLK